MAAPIAMLLATAIIAFSNISDKINFLNKELAGTRDISMLSEILFNLQDIRLLSVKNNKNQLPAGLINLQDEVACAKVAKRAADSLRGPVQTVGIVQLSDGEHCQYTARSQENTNRGATGTIFSTPEKVWVVTCNYDTRDTAAISACAQVVDGWKFE